MSSVLLLKSLQNLRFDSCRSLKRLEELRSGIALSEILSFIKSTTLPQTYDAFEYLSTNLPSPIKAFLRPPTTQNLAKIAEYLLLNLPNNPPKLKLPLQIATSLGSTSTHRSYSTKYSSRSTTNTTSRTQTVTPEVVYWAKAKGYTGDLYKEARTGVLYCEVINICEGFKTIKGFYNPAKIMSAVKINFNKAFGYMQKLKIESKYYDQAEIYKGNQMFQLGVLEDLRNYYEGRENSGYKENYADKSHKDEELERWVWELGVSWPEKLTPSRISGLLISVAEKAFKICIERPLSSDSIESSQKNISVFFNEILKVCPEIALKYSSRSRSLLSNPGLLRSILTDIKLKITTAYKVLPVSRLLHWLKSIGIGTFENFCSEFTLEFRTGLMLNKLVNRLTHEIFEFHEPVSTIQCLDNIDQALKVLFDHGLITFDAKSKAHKAFQGDSEAISVILSSIKQSYSQNSEFASNKPPTEYNNAPLTYRSITPPPTFYM